MTSQENWTSFISAKYSQDAYYVAKEIRIIQLLHFLDQALAETFGLIRPFMKDSVHLGAYDITTLKFNLSSVPSGLFDRFCLAYMLTILGNNADLFSTGHKGWEAVYLLYLQLSKAKLPVKITLVYNVYEMLKRIHNASSTTSNLREMFEEQQFVDDGRKKLWARLKDLPKGFGVNVDMVQRTLGVMGIGFENMSEDTPVPMLRREEFNKMLASNPNDKNILYVGFCQAVREITGTDPSLPTDLYSENLTRTNYFIDR